MSIFPTLGGVGHSGAPRRDVACTLGLALLLAGAVTPAHADTILTPTIVAQSLADPGVYPTFETIGTFTFTTPAYGTLVGATVSGQFGNSILSPDTAPGTYTVGGVTVFTCNLGDDCWGSAAETAWSYTFAPAELADLSSGTVVFGVSQTAPYQVQTDLTTLTLDFKIPEPSTLALFGAALLGMGLAVRRTRA